MYIAEDIQRAMLDAWDRLLPRLKSDPRALALRLARRRSPLMTRPFRAYCLAIRANDLRISPYRAIITPEHAVYKDDPRHPYEYIEHEVTLSSQLLRHLCTPIQLGLPGEPAWKVAPKLGCTQQEIGRAIKRGSIFDVRHIKGLGGRRGPATPVIYRKELLDPNGANFLMPNPVWGTHWSFLSDWIPDGIEQTLTRRPTYGHFGRDHDHFSGWNWLCPACETPVKMIYRPMPRPCLLLEEHLGRRIPEPDQVQPVLNTFACKRCHQVQDRSPCSNDLWNAAVTVFSTGLLYGKEVERPAWFPAASPALRKNIPTKRHSTPRSPHYPAVLKLLLETDLTPAQMAKALDLDRNSIRHFIRRLFQDHNATDRESLRRAVAARQQNSARGAA